MIHNGLDKLANIESFAQAYVAYLGLPFPITLSYMAAFTELIGAPPGGSRFLHPSGCFFGLFSTMCVANVSPHLRSGFEHSLSGAVCAVCPPTFLFFAINGAVAFLLMR